MYDQAKISVGVVGVGYAGRYHAEKYAASKKASLVGVADVDRDRAMEIGQKLGVAPITDYRELFGRVRCVSVAVPTRLHYEVTRDFPLTPVDIETPLARMRAQELDGKKIVFTSNRFGGQFEIFTMNADGTGLKRLTDNTDDDVQPAW
ncbi:MAG: Gfo/Idh/MocA family oxidoreductase, partial [Candidatus Binatia bacterium]